MASWYTVISYHPNALNGECVNIGVITGEQEGETRRVQFLRDWYRVGVFANGKSIDFLHDLQRAWMKQESPFTKEEVTKMASEWGNSIQLSLPRHSTLTADELLPRMVKAFLVEPE